MNEFGKFMRDFRHQNGQVSLRDLAEDLGISASLLSSYETGRRPIKDGKELLQRISAALNMNDIDQRKMRVAVDKSLESFRVDLGHVDPSVRDKYVAFARRLPGFTAEEIAKLGSDNDNES